MAERTGGVTFPDAGQAERQDVAGALEELAGGERAELLDEGARETLLVEGGERLARWELGGGPQPGDAARPAVGRFELADLEEQGERLLLAGLREAREELGGHGGQMELLEERHEPLAHRGREGRGRHARTSVSRRS